jgi:hypothetical protein
MERTPEDARLRFSLTFTLREKKMLLKDAMLALFCLVLIVPILWRLRPVKLITPF